MEKTRRKLTITAYLDHYYNNQVVKIGLIHVKIPFREGNIEETKKAFLEYKGSLDGILPPLEVIDEISHTKSSELPQEVKDALEAVKEEYDYFKREFEKICEEFPLSLETCPKTFWMTLNYLGLVYEKITNTKATQKFNELY